MSNKIFAGFGSVVDVLSPGDRGIAIILLASERLVVTSITAGLNNANNAPGATQGTLTAAEAAGASALVYFKMAAPAGMQLPISSTFTFQYGAGDALNFSNAQWMLPIRVGVTTLQFDPASSPFVLEKGEAGIFMLCPPSQDGGKLGTGVPWLQNAVVSLAIGGRNSGANPLNVTFR